MWQKQVCNPRLSSDGAGSSFRASADRRQRQLRNLFSALNRCQALQALAQKSHARPDVSGVEVWVESLRTATWPLKEPEDHNLHANDVPSQGQQSHFDQIQMPLTHMGTFVQFRVTVKGFLPPITTYSSKTMAGAVGFLLECTSGCDASLCVMLFCLRARISRKCGRQG